MFKQVEQFLIINLNKGHKEVEFDSFKVIQLAHLVEHILNRPWNNPVCFLIRFWQGLVPQLLVNLHLVPIRAKHGVRLSRARLAISKYCAAEALEHFVQSWFDEVKHLFLSVV